MANEVRIKLTAEQKAKIKSATGKVVNEIRVGSLGSNLAVTSATSVSARAQIASARTARAVTETSARAARAIPARAAVTEASARTARAVTEATARTARTARAVTEASARTARATTARTARAVANRAMRSSDEQG